VTVTVRDFCQCYVGTAQERAIDLSRDAFRRLAPIARPRPGGDRLTDQILMLRQRPDHVAHVGETVLLDGDPFVIRSIKPKREAGVFLDYGRAIESNEVELTVERFDGYDG
jgi:hypothetical protein